MTTLTKHFDSDLHVYRHRTRLPGATDVIKSEGLVNTEWMTDEARWRGKCVHRGVDLVNKGTIDWETVDGIIAGYLRSYERFLLTTKFEVAGGEEPCFDDAFACMPDIWGLLYGVKALVELKTGPIPDWAAIQTALQKRALEKEKGFRVVKRFGLRLMADGSLAKLIHFDDSSDERVAMSMVDSFHWKLNHGYIRNWK